MNLFGVGPAEAGLVFVIALIVVGPQRFPEIMRQAGRWYRMARAYSNEVMKDVRSAVDDIEREVRAETDDLKSVGELADLGQDLRRAREDAEEIHRDTRSVLRDEPKPVRPSQRSANSAPSDGAESAPMPNSNGNAAEVAEAVDEGHAVASKRPSPAVPPIERQEPEPAEGASAEAPSGTAEAPSDNPKPAKPKPAEQKPDEKPAATFDPFKREKPRKGPVVVTRESVSSEGDDRL